MNADQRPAGETPYEAPVADDVEIVAGTSETATGNVSQPPNIG
jgi:hypothetical protein